MSLISRITTRLRQFFQPRTQTTGAETEEAERRPSTSNAVKLLDRFKEERGRREIIQVCREMYTSDPRADGVISTLARDAVRHGVQVQVTDGPDANRAQELASDLVERLRLPKRLDDWFRLALRDGDSFLESSVDEEDILVEVTRKPTLEMHRNSNRADRFDDPARAFWYGPATWVGTEPPRDAIWFAQWQIVHARWHHDEGSRYGTPLFASARGAWKRTREGETDISIRRKTRSGMKFLHSLEDATPGDVERYREENKAALNNPFAAIADFFTNKKATVSAIQGDARLGEIGDVKHHIDTWWISSPVPKGLLGYGEDLNRDVLEKQKEQYDEALETITGWLEDQIVKPLLELQWMLQGIWPASYTYHVVWPKKQVVTPAVLKDLGEALFQLQRTNLFPDEVLVNLAVEVLPGIDVDTIMAYIQQRRAMQAEDRIAAAGQETLRRLRPRQERDLRGLPGD